MQFLKFNVQTQGQTWLDAFFVQNHNRIHKKFNLKAFIYYLRLQKSQLYFQLNLLWILQFLKFNELSQGQTWLDAFLCKIIANSVRNSIENTIWLANLPGWKFRIKIYWVYRLSLCNFLEVQRANSRSHLIGCLFCAESL